MTTPKPFDEPESLHVKSISVHWVDYLDFDKGWPQSMLFPSTLFNSTAEAPLQNDMYSFSGDLVGGPVNPGDIWGNGEGYGGVMYEPMPKYTYDKDGHYVAFQGNMSANSSVHRPNGYGVLYKSKVYHNGYSEGLHDAVVVDGFLVVLTEATGKSALSSCTYQDLNDPNSVEEWLFDIATVLDLGDNRTTEVVITEAAGGSTVYSGDYVADESAARQAVKSNHPRSLTFSTGRIDPNDLTLSLLCTAWSNFGDEASSKEAYQGVLDINVVLEVYYRTVANEDETFTTTRHLGILTTTDSATEENNTADFRDAVTAVNYTDDTDYPNRVAAMKAATAGVCFNWFASETFALVQTVVNNLPCSGRVYTTLRKEINVYGWNTEDPPEWVVVGSEWLNVTEAGPEPGDIMEEDTIGLLGASNALFAGAASMKYELTGSRKIGYAFINGSRQYLTAKAAPGKSSVSFNAVVNLNHLKIHKNSARVVDWAAYSEASATTAYRLGEVYLGHKAVLDSYLAALVGDSWVVAPTGEQMVTAVTYDDGSYLEGCVDGLNQVVGGDFSYEYSSSGLGFHEYTTEAGSFATDLKATSVSYLLTGADERQPSNPFSFYPAGAYLKADDKLGALTAYRPGAHYGGAARPPVDKVASAAAAEAFSVSNSNNIGSRLCASGLTTLTSTMLQEAYASWFLGFVTIVSAQGGPSVSEANLVNSYFKSESSLDVDANNLNLTQDLGASQALVIGGLTDQVHQFRADWTSFQEAFDNYDSVLFDGAFPTAFILNNVPIPAAYSLVSVSGVPVGFHQFIPSTNSHQVVWVNNGELPTFPPIVPEDKSQVQVLNGDMGEPFAGVRFYYDASAATFRAMAQVEHASPTYTLAEVSGAESTGGFVGSKEAFISTLTLSGVYQNNAILWRVPVPGTSKFMYTASCYRATDAPAEDSLSFTFVGTSAGAVLEVPPILKSLPLWETDIAADVGYFGDELVLGVIE